MDVGEVFVDRVQGVWVFTLVGEHDISIQPSLQQRLERTFDAGSNVIVDLSQIEFMDSSVLLGLAYGSQRVAEAPEHTLAIVAPADGIARRLLTLTGIDKDVPVWGTRTEALAHVRPPTDPCR
jgi:anti-anti-sigma factor